VYIINSSCSYKVYNLYILMIYLLANCIVIIISSTYRKRSKHAKTSKTRGVIFYTSILFRYNIYRIPDTLLFTFLFSSCFTKIIIMIIINNNVSELPMIILYRNGNGFRQVPAIIGLGYV